MTDYPATLAKPSLGGFSMVAGAGVIRDGDPMSKVQRRVFNTVPHNLTLVFNMPAASRLDWTNWVKTYGYRWFNIALPTLYAGLLNTKTSMVLIRFTSSVQWQNVSLLYLQAAVGAEMAPSMVAKILAAP